MYLLFSFIIIYIAIINGEVIVNSTADDVPNGVFNGVYSECFLHLSYSCLQKKTLLYLKELDNMSEVSVIGDYVKFVKINKSDVGYEDTKSGDTEELAFMIDDAIDHFFDNHVLKFYALGRNLSMPRNVDEFIGRKKRKGGGGGMMGGHGGGGHDDGGKKKMMMMAMMCMKMKLMMMVPAMMGMMGMMSFKGMMFSMMSFMISKMMLLMKILEKKGGGIGGGGGGGGLDGGWAAGGTGGGAWMPAGGQDYTGGGGGGGYDANGQWQSRSIIETPEAYKTIIQPSDKNEDVRVIDNLSNNKWQIGSINKLRMTEKSIDQGHDDKWNIKTLVSQPGDIDEDAISSTINDKWQRETIDKLLLKPKNQWQYRFYNENSDQNKPEISFVKPVVRYNNKKDEHNKKPVLVYKKSNVNFDFDEPKQENDKDKSEDIHLRIKRDTDYISNEYVGEDNDGEEKQRYIDDKRKIAEDIESYRAAMRSERESKLKHKHKRSIIDLLQNSYIYWMNNILGLNNNRRTNLQRYKVINGIKYVYTPYRLQQQKTPKGIPMNNVKVEDLRNVAAIEDFNKGEIIEAGVESRMNKKFSKIKDSVNDTLEDNPWE